MLQVVRKLKLLKKGLKKLNAQYFRHIEIEAKQDRESLIQAQKQLQLNPGDQGLQQDKFQKYQKFRRSSYLTEVYLQQKSKANWIKLRDDNTGYFHSVIKHMNFRSNVTQLKDV